MRSVPSTLKTSPLRVSVRPQAMVRALMTVALVMAAAGCDSKEAAPVPDEAKPRPEVNLDVPTTQPVAGSGHSGDPHAGMHAGGSGHALMSPHGPGGGLPLPDRDEKLTTGEVKAGELTFTIPEDLTPQPTRPMTLRIFSGEKAEGDPEDVDLALSDLGNQQPLEGLVEFWCGRFEIPEGKTCQEIAKVEELEGLPYPASLVEIEGTYKGGMMSRGPAKEGYIQINVEIRVPGHPHYVKLTGPKKTVDKWRDTFMEVVKSAKK